MVFDGLSFFRDFNVKYYTDSKNASHGWISLKCPFHNDHSDHLGFNPDSGAFSCWRCGKKPALLFVQTILHGSNKEALSVYQKYLKKGGGSSFISNRKITPAASVELPGYDFTSAERKYLESRDLWRLREYADFRSGGLVGDWAYRIVIPVVRNGIVVSATGRAINKEMNPRYWTLPSSREVTHHKHIFLGMDHVEDFAVVVEGPLDAIKGGPGFMASFGVNLTDEQLCALLDIASILFLKDNDEAGNGYDSVAYRLATLGHKSVEVGTLPKEYKDVGDMPKEAIDELRKEVGLGSFSPS